MIEIRHLEWITVTADGRKVLGYNQEWYPEKRQKLAGCGPTVGAMIAAYVEMKEWQMPVTTKEGATSKMLDIWKYATPRMHGLYKTRWLKEGLEAYMKERGLKGTPEAMPIPPIHMLAPSFEKLKNFIAEGLASDCPVGFLNLHSGGEPIPYHWHWMPLVKIEERDGKTLCTRSFTYTGFTDKNRIVLCTAGKNLDNPLDFLFSADYRINFTVLCGLSKISAEFIKSRTAFL